MSGHKLSSFQGTVACMVFIVIGVLILLALGRLYYYGENSKSSLQNINQQIVEYETRIKEQTRINNRLRAEVSDLKTETFAIEEHARMDLGLIKSGETFIQLSNAPVAYSRYVLHDEQVAAEQAIEPIDEIQEIDATNNQKPQNPDIKSE